MLILPLIIMGIISVIGGLTGLRLPETLYHKLPQTVEEGEAFGKDFTWKDFCRCVPIRFVFHHIAFYVMYILNFRPDIDEKYEDLELEIVKEEVTEETPLENVAQRRMSKRILTRQTSFMDTQKDSDGAMNITYWF